jgi:hypothetical protein
MSGRTHTFDGVVAEVYDHDGAQVGVLTGEYIGDGIVLRNIVLFPRAPRVALRRLVRAGIAEAWRRGARFLVLAVQQDNAMLDRLARRAGFRTYNYDPERAVFWYVLHPKEDTPMFGGGSAPKPPPPPPVPDPAAEKAQDAAKRAKEDNQRRAKREQQLGTAQATLGPAPVERPTLTGRLG